MSLNLANISVSYPDTDAVKDVTLEVKSGERFAIMGPSGSGKSTLLRAIAGLAVMQSGSVHINGADMTGVPAHQRPVGLMFQDYALFPHMAVLENVAYGLRMNGVPKTERNERAAKLLELVGLAGFAERRTTTLSGGEQQRVALARTLAPSPAVVLLDEPLGSLDISLKESLLAETRSILEAVGATSVYVTHDRAEAFAFCDRMAILDKGEVVRVGTPDEIWRDPQSAFVARSIGQSNLVPHSMIDDGGAGLVFVPLEAVTMSPSGRFSAPVTTSRFEDGSNIVAVAFGGEGSSLEMRAPLAATPGVEVRFDIEVDTLIVVSANEV